MPRTPENNVMSELSDENKIESHQGVNIKGIYLKRGNT